MSAIPWLCALLSSKLSDTTVPGVLEENGVSPSKVFFRLVVGVGPTGDRNPRSLVLSLLLDDDGPKSRNSVSFRFRGNMIGVLRIQSELSTSEVAGGSDVGGMGGFFEELVVLAVVGDNKTKGRLFEEKDEWFRSSCGLDFSLVRKPEEERPEGHWICSDAVS